MNNLERKLEAKKVLKGLVVFGIIFVLLSVLFGVIFYNGFFFGVPSSATYLTTYNNLDITKSWETFKTNHTQLDPKLVQSSDYYQCGVQISDVGWRESATRPHNYLSFQVSFSTYFEVYQQYSPSYSKATLKQPSFLILLLDQNDRIRGKLYSIQGSADNQMVGNNRTDVTLWFEIPKDMENQPVSVIVEVFGILESRTDTDPNSWYDDQYHTNTHNGFYDSVDDVYGSIPFVQSQNLQAGYSNLNFVAYDRILMHTPASLSVLDLASYSDLLALAIGALGATVYLTRNKTKQWWTKNKVYVVIGALFLVTYIVILIIVGVIM